MYRKYSGLTKCSRNERLAQLSEQENVIERKKKEILAKIEAKKKKETEEALRKFEPTSSFRNDSSESKVNFCLRERDAEDEELKPEIPRNAFSNDGSFLDHFKKLSRSGLGSAKFSASVRNAKKEEEESSKIKEEYVERGENKKLIENTQSRWGADGHIKGRKSFDSHLFSRNSQDYNNQRQLPYRGVNHSVSEEIPGASSKLKPGENNSKDNLSFTISAPASLIKFTGFERKWQNQEPDESSDNGNHLMGSEKNKSMKKQSWNSSRGQSQCHTSIPSSNKNSSFGFDNSTGISPAFTHEVDNSVTSGNYHSSKTVGQGEEAPGLSTTVLDNTAKKFLSEKNTDGPVAMNYFNPDKLRGVGYMPKTGENTDVKECNTGRKGKRRNSKSDSSDSDSDPKESFPLSSKTSHNINQHLKGKSGDGYQADCEGDSITYKITDERQKKFLPRNTEIENLPKPKEVQDESKDNENVGAGNGLTSGETRKRRKKSRWGDEVVPPATSNEPTNSGPQRSLIIPPVNCASTGKTPLLSKLTRSDPGLIQYAKQTFGSTNLSEEDWKKAEDHYKINLLYQDMVKKRAEIERLEKAGKFKYEYDSDEDVEGGTWEHKLRQQEMLATQLWAEELTRQAAGKHHIGDFLPPEELERFMERYNAVKQGRKPDLSDYKEFKLKEDNVGYRLLQKMGWNEGQGLGQDGSGITNPINKASTRTENQGLGVERPDGLEAGDDEYDAYRKRMMLAYRFRPNPLNNPRRPYY